MKSFITRITLLLAVLAGLSTVTACERDEGPAEDMGEELDQMGE